MRGATLRGESVVPLPLRMVSRSPRLRRGMLELPETIPGSLPGTEGMEPLGQSGGRPGSLSPAAGLPGRLGESAWGAPSRLVPGAPGIAPGPGLSRLAHGGVPKPATAPGMLLGGPTPRPQDAAVLTLSP